MPAYGEASFHAHCPCFDRIVYISVTELNEFPKTYTTYKQNGQKGCEGERGGQMKIDALIYGLSNKVSGRGIFWNGKFSGGTGRFHYWPGA